MTDIKDITLNRNKLCKVYNKDTGVLIKDTYEAGWGTGTILYSSKEFSLIQTANHVAVVKDALNGNLKRVCSGFYIERRNQDDKIIHVFKGNTKIVAKDPLSDLAVIKVFYNFNVSSRIAQDTYLGQSIRIIGFPSLRGIKAKRLSYEKGYVATRLGDAGWLKHQTRFGTAAYFGNSGGAVWNQQGEIVGTVTNLVGFSTLLGDYIPQQNCVYGPGARALQNFYNSYKDLKFLLKI